MKGRFAGVSAHLDALSASFARRQNLERVRAVLAAEDTTPVR